MKFLKTVAIMFIVFQTGYNQAYAGFEETPAYIKFLYLKPTDVDNPSQRKLEYLHSIIVEVQVWYGSQMHRDGYGNKTFAIDLDRAKDPNIVTFDGKLRKNQYDVFSVVAAIPEDLDADIGATNNIQVVLVGGLNLFEGGAVRFAACSNGECVHTVIVPGNNRTLLNVYLAHELGHAFWLQHTHTKFENGKQNIMFPAQDEFGVKHDISNYRLEQADTKILSSNKFFHETISRDIESLFVNSQTIATTWGDLKVQE